jgi:hypothetical protein
MDFFPASLLQKKTGQSKSHLFYIDPMYLEHIKEIRQFKKFKEEIKKLGYKALKIAKPGKQLTEFNWSIFDAASIQKAIRKPRKYVPKPKQPKKQEQSQPKEEVGFVNPARAPEQVQPKEEVQPK